MTALGLAGLNAVRLAEAAVFVEWWIPGVVLAAVLVADLGSGVVHWAADTWGSEATPLVGRRFLKPFRVHHVNPDDILRRGFVDLNGDVALLALPLLAGGLLVPLTDAWERLTSLFLVALGVGSLPTNQIHQWAHGSRVSPWIRWLQRRGLILSPEHHQRHHAAPHTTHYCITTGWCNAALTTIGFFPTLERWIARATGHLPRPFDAATSPAGSPRAFSSRTP